MNTPPVIPSKLKGLRVSLAHDWLITMRGGEKVLQALMELFPSANLYTLFRTLNPMTSFIAGRSLKTSFVQFLPGLNRSYRYWLPLFPLALKTVKVEDCDLLLSSSHCVIKALPPPPGSRHISYIHSPMRYVWDQFPHYYRQAGLSARLGLRLLRRPLQIWDQASNKGVDHFIANSAFVAQRVECYYQRPALVVHPPVDTSLFSPCSGKKGYYLVVSALAPYKRVDLAIQACRQLRRPLKIVGSGPDLEALRALAGPETEFLGWCGSRRLASLYAGAKALLFPGEEDFGIAPLEAMASGCPVLAYGKGGALETVAGQKDARPTGRFFYAQTVPALRAAMESLEKDLPHFNQEDLLKRAATFSLPIFKQKMLDSLASLL
ncbi:MAG: glycosyltransferase [Desulfarculales bacterium]|jgi:glycosyltransferase involved in cell wall biosynthesis|nr:glycosyltransferase [Desulfarculales bacterium]